MAVKLLIDEQKGDAWLLTKDDGPPYFFVGDAGDRSVVYSSKTGEFLGVRLKLIDPKLEYYHIKPDAD